MRTKILLLVFFSLQLFSQTIDRTKLCRFCKCNEQLCGPWNKIDSVEIISNEKTEIQPFNYILHIETKGSFNQLDYGTVSFINENNLITAKHVVSKILKGIKLSKTGKGNDEWITFEKNDFKVSKYKYADIAVVKLLNKNKIEKLYAGNFKIKPLNSFKVENLNNKTIYLSGYPCYFADLEEKHDNLINRKTNYKNLNLSKENYINYKNVYLYWR